MKKYKNIAVLAFAVSAAIVVTDVRIVAAEPTPTEEATVGAMGCADTCGYAVVDSNGVVHGVIVCQEGCFGGTMPDEYMGCPPGCSLVLQAPQDSNGNVAGIHGPNIIFNPSNNNFEVINPDDGQVQWSLPSGQPFENATYHPPTTTVPPAPPVNEQPVPSPELSVPVAPAPEETTPTAEAPSGSVSPLAYRSGANVYTGTTSSSFFTRILTATGKAKTVKVSKTRAVSRPSASVMRIVRY